MEDLMIEKTKSTPFIYLSQVTNSFILKGESFPENSAKFYAPVLEWIREYITALDVHTKVIMDFEIIYFNSSTSKIFMTIFDLLDEAAMAGKNITVNWKCDENNETAIECGEEFQEDLGYLSFNIVTK
jgi:Domain of unknown function (DUF1987).